MSIEARRHTPRVKLCETAFINFGSGNRAVVLDVSEGGLRFKGSSPLPNSQPVRFWLTIEQRIEGVADLAWSDESRMLGGLRFTNVPPEIRAQIRSWVEGSALTPSISAEVPLSAPHFAAAAQTVAEDPATDDSEPPLATMVALAGEEETEASRTAHEESSNRAETPVFPIRHGLIEKTNRLSMFSSDAPAPTEYSYSDLKNSASHRVAAAVLIVLFAVVAVVGVLSYLYPGPMLHAMSRFEDKVSSFINPGHKEPISNVEPASMGPVDLPIESAPPAPNIVAGEGNQALAPFSASAGNGLSQSADQQQSIASKNNEAAPQVRNNSQADLSLAQSYLAEGGTPSQKAKAVELLWLATEKGNVDAEIQLADLYSGGVAVQKSCVQARILLKAAAAASSSVAQQKLSELDQSDCR